ncbi:MAG: divalent-cation tolerance protein CutA [Candidatus Acidiferrales bacterium]
MTDKIVVLVTCGSAKEAHRIARSLVEQRLAACVNFPDVAVRSVYRWKGKVESGREFPLVIKSSRKQFARLESAIKKLHSYDVPEIIALPIVSGSREYLAWLGESIRPAGPRKKNPH